MSSREMSDTLMFAIAEIYVEGVEEPKEYHEKTIRRYEEAIGKDPDHAWKYRSLIEQAERDRKEDIRPYYTYDDLAVTFDRSKSSIHEAIRQKEAQVRNLRNKVTSELEEFRRWKEQRSEESKGQTLTPNIDQEREGFDRD